MRKKKKSTLDRLVASKKAYATLMVCMLLLCAFLAFETYQAKSYKWEMQQPRQAVQYHENLYFYGDISDEGLRGHFISLINLPDWLVKHFREAGGTVYLTDTMYVPTPGDIPEREVWGMFWAGSSVDSPEIWVYHNSYATFTSAHEFGHYLDFILGTMSESEAFLEIFEKEHEAFLQFYARHSAFSYTALHDAFSSVDEYFAEFFAWYCLGHLSDALYSSLKEECPETYGFFEWLLAELYIENNRSMLVH